MSKENRQTDLTDSPRDRERLLGDDATLNLPEWKDIPTPKARPTGLVPGDVTASSADEEGAGVLDEDSANGEEVSSLDEDLLDQPYDPSYDTDVPVAALSLDDTDDDGDRLEESGLQQDLFGKDLDDSLEQEEDEEDEGASE